MAKTLGTARPTRQGAHGLLLQIELALVARRDEPPAQVDPPGPANSNDPSPSRTFPPTARPEQAALRSTHRAQDPARA